MERYVAPMLSHQRIGAFGRHTPNSDKRDWTQVNSADASARNLYSDSVKDLETVCCFFEDQGTRATPKYIA